MMSAKPTGHELEALAGTAAGQLVVDFLKRRLTNVHAVLRSATDVNTIFTQQGDARCCVELAKRLGHKLE